MRIQGPQSKIHPAVRDKLLKSGLYHEAPNGQVRSRNLFYQRSPGDRHPRGFPCLIAGQVGDIKPGFAPAHYYRYMSSTDFWKNEWHKGIEYCVRIEEPGSPSVYVVDDHRLAYYAWHEALALESIQLSSTLLHIDQHTDSMDPFDYAKIGDLRASADYARFILNELSFIVPAVAEGLIGQFWNFNINPGQRLDWQLKGDLKAHTLEIRRIQNLIEYYSDVPCSANTPQEQEATLQVIVSRFTEPQELIIDIDLDALVEREYKHGLPTTEQFEEALGFLAEIARKAGVVTIATSPSYASQEIAIPLAQELVKRIIA